MILFFRFDSGWVYRNLQDSRRLLKKSPQYLYRGLFLFYSNLTNVVFKPFKSIFSNRLSFA